MRKKKKHFRRNKWNILWGIIVLIAWFTAIKFDFIMNARLDQKSHLNILKISALFAGFLYTSLGIMVGMLEKQRIEKLNRAGYMDNYFNAIYISIGAHIIAILLSVINIMSKSGLIPLFSLIEQLALVAGIIFFAKSVWNVRRIIEKVRADQYKS
ncbi:hypothetical protein [Paludifilum halophilum]|uniref:Uncharacterized protein n=1 Tax=Paludifilum halophilum TaxID=1642702 RepID=A0A235B1E8_9BACL|nr:hypothetical protein [Paludifilum halophilum]OYD06120.1 hypothetical protein CHM34_18045 [Paludifilum halophilum]